MEIKYFGHSSFRIKSRTITVVTDPFDTAMVGLPFSKTPADIVTISHDHADHNQLEKIEGNPLIFRGPGEYEVQGVRLYGYPTFHDSSLGSERGRNTMFLIEIDGVRTLHAGDLGHELSDALVEEIGEVHVLLIPVGGHFTIDAKIAHKIVRQIEPLVVVPMHYKTETSKIQEISGVDMFLKEMDKTTEPQPKLTITRDALPEDLEVVVLSHL